MKYLSSLEISKRWNISDRQVRNYCKEGRILGSYLEGKVWMIPENTIKPTRKQKESSKASELLDRLKEEKKHNIKGGIYHKLQILMTYNSNHIEGSKIDEEQTRMIFETNTIGEISTTTKVDDIIETLNHFRCIDYIIDNAHRKLSESFIKKIHYMLKESTSDSRLDWFNIGEYKSMPNEVGGISTTSPENVSKEINKLINKYNKQARHSLNDIIEFHYEFESIHPFQDGNGRVGRLIMLKECLNNSYVPILIKDDFKLYYYRGLKEYKKEKGYLIDMCLHGQDIMKEYLDYFRIKYRQ